MPKDTVSVGAGAGFAGDRVHPAVDLAASDMVGAEIPRVCARPHGWVRGAGRGSFERLSAWTERAEALSIDGVFLGDRLMTEAVARDGSAVYGASMPEVTTALAGLGARTERILLGPLVLVFPYRHPLQLAKLVAGLDQIASGRLVLGAGLGWNRREFAALGIDRSARGAMFEASVEVVRALWRGEAVTDETPWWRLEEAAISPLPERPDGPPIWLASFSPDSALAWDELPPLALRTLDRVGRLADGWVPLIYSASSRRRLDPKLIGRGWEIVQESAERAGRKPSDLEFVLSDWIYVLDGPASERRCREALATFFAGDWDDARRTYTIGTAEEVAESLLGITSQVDRVGSYVLTPLDGHVDQLELVAGELAPLLRGAGR